MSDQFRPFSASAPAEDADWEPESDDEDEFEHQSTEHGIPSFAQAKYQSSEMRRLIMLREPEATNLLSSAPVNYKSADVFPDWVLTNNMWKSTTKFLEKDNEISEILKIPVLKRSQEHISTLIHWLMSVWGLANTMGFKRCGNMFKEFKYTAYDAGDNIIKEGERGLTFYIIISGTTTVHKEGIGIVGQLTKGKSFGEIALTQGKDLRTATVTALTKVEVLSLHKHDYDYFVRDLQEMERRENFQILSQCALFKSWPKGKIEKICNTCMRRTFEAGQYIFRQGDSPEDLYVVVEGTLNIFKELVIVCKNRWPVATHKWKQRVKRVTQPIMLKALQRGDYFGEVAILKNQTRSTSAIASTRVVLISLDKLEFLHSVNQASSQVASQEEEEVIERAIRKYIGDDEVMDRVGEVKGGPSSAAYLGSTRVASNRSDSRPSTASPSRSPSPRGRGNSLHQRPRSSPHGSGAPQGGRHTGGKTRSPNGSQRNSSAFMEAAAIAQDEQVAEQMRRAAMEASLRDVATRPNGFDFGEVFKAKTERRPPRTPGTPGTPKGRPGASKVRDGLPTLVARTPPGSPSKMSSGLRNKVEATRRTSMQFVLPNKRNSLVGLDNEAGGYVFDPNKIVLRKNSVIRIGMVYEHIYQKLQAQTIQTMEGPEGAQRPRLMRKASAMLSNTLQVPDPAMAPPGSPGPAGSKKPQAMGEVAFNSIEEVYDQNPLLFKLARNESMRRTVHMQQSQRSMSSDDMHRGGSKELKLLNKSKISYRDAIQG